MDADDLARGRALLERSRDTTGSWQDWQAAGNYWRDWLVNHAAALLDAAERAARLEAALQLNDARIIEAVRHALYTYQERDWQNKGGCRMYSASLADVALKAIRAALAPEKGDGDVPRV